MNSIRRAALTTVTATALAIIGAGFAAGPANARVHLAPEQTVASASANTHSLPSIVHY